MFLEQYCHSARHLGQKVDYVCQFLHIFAQSLLSLEKRKEVHEDVE